MDKLAVFLAIHLLVPALGVYAYWRLCAAMRAAGVVAPPVIQLFFLFATYGGVLLVILTALFWKWSGMASLGVGYLLLGAPIVVGVCATTVDAKRSRYHEVTRQVALAYYGLWLPFVGLLAVARP